MDKVHRPIDDVKYDIEVIKKKVSNIENNISILKSMHQDIHLLLTKLVSDKNETPIKTGWWG